MRLAKRIFLAIIISFAGSSPAFADTPAPAVGNGGSVGALQGVYNASPPTLTTGQTAPLQLDPNGNLKVSPFSLIFGSPFQTYPATGVGASTAFPGSVSTTGTSLGALPAGASALRLQIPIGASVTYYVATSAAASAAAAALVAVTRNNSSSATDNLTVDIPLNANQVFVTNYTSGSSTTYISGIPTYRFI